MYLNDKLKHYYLEALKEVEKSEIDFWKIENGITTHLKTINKSNNIQSLYSKHSKDCSYTNESYLVIAYSEKVELTIFRKILPFFIYKYNNYESSCIYSFNIPYVRDSKKGTLNLKCVDDPNYFNVNHIRVTLLEGNSKLHEEFWTDLAEQFSKL